MTIEYLSKHYVLLSNLAKVGYVLTFFVHPFQPSHHVCPLILTLYQYCTRDPLSFASCLKKYLFVKFKYLQEVVNDEVIGTFFFHIQI